MNVNILITKYIYTDVLIVNFLIATDYTNISQFSIDYSLIYN